MDATGARRFVHGTGMQSRTMFPNLNFRRTERMNADEWHNLSRERFKRLFRKSPMARKKYDRFMKNVNDILNAGLTSASLSAIIVTTISLRSRGPSNSQRNIFCQVDKSGL